MSEDSWLPEAPDGHEWVRPKPADCPSCPCHTARVCEQKAWHRSHPRHEGCPCEAGAIAADTPPVTRTLTITVAGVSRTVTAEAPTVGIGAGLLLTPRIFRATGSHLPAEAVVPMVLAPATEHTPAALVAVDELGQRWTIRLTAFHGGSEVAITGWHDAWHPGTSPLHFLAARSGAGRVPRARRAPGGPPTVFRGLVAPPCERAPSCLPAPTGPRTARA